MRKKADTRQPQEERPIKEREKGPVNKDMENRLQDVYRTNRNDAAALVKLFSETGDIEDL